VLALVNHFKSKRGGGDEQRLRQATRVKEIVLQRLAEHPNLVLADFNDTPDSENLKPLARPRCARGTGSGALADATHAVPFAVSVAEAADRFREGASSQATDSCRAVRQKRTQEQRHPRAVEGVRASSHVDQEMV
jgi:endonuclease/exonuclease/phosphatase family metal-dependent hydrolase